ncbi:hypothetical protein V6N13_092299 [Hibiscus sabdariffa]
MEGRRLEWRRERTKKISGLQSIKMVRAGKKRTVGDGTNEGIMIGKVEGGDYGFENLVADVELHAAGVWRIVWLEIWLAIKAHINPMIKVKINFSLLTCH